jgi:pimeloyl-ACP methyl ester carboxylesterase
MMDHLIERTQLLGPSKSLVGVLTQPAEVAGEAQARPMVVILNSGIIHRVGPNRLGVLLARALAGQGNPVLRFDLSGIGDSDPRTDHLSPLDAALADIRDALDWAEAHQSAQKFILVGLCSGADHAVVYAGSDKRVTGLVIMDPTVPPTRRFLLRQYLRRLNNAGLWRRLLTGHFTTWRRLMFAARGRATDAQATKGLDLSGPEVRQYLENAYRQALDVNRECLAIFTDGVPSRHNYARQLSDALPGVDFGPRFRLEYCHGADHTFSDEARRDQLIDMVVEWARGAAVRLVVAICWSVGIGLNWAEFVVA